MSQKNTNLNLKEPKTLEGGVNIGTQVLAYS